MAMSDLLLRIAIIEKNERGQEVELVRKTMQFKPQVNLFLLIIRIRFSTSAFLKFHKFLNIKRNAIRISYILVLRQCNFKFMLEIDFRVSISIDDCIGSMCTNQRTSLRNQRIRSSQSIWIISYGWRSKKRCLVGAWKNSGTLSPTGQRKYSKIFILNRYNRALSKIMIWSRTNIDKMKSIQCLL